jgi:hypothetical protein
MIGPIVIEDASKRDFLRSMAAAAVLILAILDARHILRQMPRVHDILITVTNQLALAEADAQIELPATEEKQFALETRDPGANLRLQERKAYERARDWIQIQDLEAEIQFNKVELNRMHRDAFYFNKRRILQAKQSQLIDLKVHFANE